MSNEENLNQTEEAVAAETTAQPTEAASPASASPVASILAMKDSNPKVFYGAIGGVVALLLIIMMSGGNDSGELKGPVMKDLAVGQRYTLKSANAYDPVATVRLVPVPGAMEAYDDTEEADRNSACQHIEQGTPVTVVGLQDMYGKKNAFVKVKIEEGVCKDRDGWALGIDVQ